jgi:hypothetical protein
MIVVSYKNTMRNVVPVRESHEQKKLSGRAALIAMSRRYIEEQNAIKVRQQQELERRREEAAARRAKMETERDRLQSIGPVHVEGHPQRIIATVEAFHGLEPGTIFSQSKTRNTVVPARYDAIVAVYLNCRIDGRQYSLPELGRAFRRDHTSVLHALRTRGLK